MLTNKVCRDRSGLRLAAPSEIIHRNERAFTQAAEPGFLPAGELPRAGFDAVDAGSQRRVGAF